MPNKQSLCLSAHDELYILDLNKVLYMQADDHYTEVFYTMGTRFMIPFGLGKIEAVIAEKKKFSDKLIRLGRKYMVNGERIFRISSTKEMLYLVDDDGANVSLHVPKPVLRILIDQIRQANT